MRVYIVLPEVFRANAWVRSAADRLAAQVHPALAVPLFARTPPGLELAYDTSDSAVGRRYKCATNSWQILIDVAASASWFRARYPRLPSTWWAFASGGMLRSCRPRCPEWWRPLISMERA